MSHQNDDDERDFLEGFDNAVLDQDPSAFNDTPATQDQAQPSAAPAPAAAPSVGAPEEAPPPDDPFAGLPQAVKDLLAEVPRMRTEVEGLRRTAGMVPALQSQIDKLKSGREAAPSTETAQPAARFPKVEKVREELPDYAEALDEVIQAFDASQRAATTPAPAPQTTTDTASDPILEALDEVRPGWSDTLFSTDCQLYLSSLPPQRQEEIKGTTRPGVMLKFLNEFDAAKARTQSTQQLSSDRSRRMASAVTPRGDGRAMRGAAPVDDEEADFIAGWNASGR